MLKCWTEAPDKRSPFADLVPSFTSLLEEVAEYMDFAVLSADEAQGGETMTTSKRDVVMII